MTLRRILVLLGVSLLIACGKLSSDYTIFGHWRAERLQLQGVSMPMGPEFVVDHTELRSLNGDVRIPILSVTTDGDTVMLGVPLEFGLHFQFYGPNRISFDMPLVGKIYYQRIIESARAAENSAPLPVRARPVDVAPDSVRMSSSDQEINSRVPPKNIMQKPASGALGEAEKDPSSAHEQLGYDPMSDYYLCIIRMRQGDADGAVRTLHDAFRHGFRDFTLLEHSPDLAALRSDPRYIALVTRYR